MEPSQSLEQLIPNRLIESKILNNNVQRARFLRAEVEDEQGKDWLKKIFPKKNDFYHSWPEVVFSVSLSTVNKQLFKFTTLSISFTAEQLNQSDTWL